MIAELEIVKVFVLVMVRCTGLLATAPFLGSANIPPMVKAGLAALLAFLITAVLPPLATPLPDTLLPLLYYALGELLIGVIIGFVMTFVFAAIQLGGQVMDMQTGFGMMNVFNPALETQFPIFGFFLFIVAMLYFLALNLHHLMLKALAASFDHVPLGGFVATPEMLWQSAKWAEEIFIDGLMIAAPVAAAMMLAYVSMGLLGRVVPQIHLFVIGFPITMSMGLLLTALIIGVYLQMLDGMFFRMFQHVEGLLRAMG